MDRANHLDWLIALHRRAVDRVAHAHVREALQAYSALDYDVVADWPTLQLCGSLPAHSPDAHSCARLYQAGLAEALRDMGRPGAMLSSLTGGAGLVIPTKGVQG
jgi:hypothetical protein